MNTKEALLTGDTPLIHTKLILTSELNTLPGLIPLGHETVGEKRALPVKITCYVSSRDAKATLVHILKTHEALSRLPVTIVVQPPLGEYDTALQFWYIAEKLARKTDNGNCLALELKNGDQWLFMAQDPDPGESTFEKSAKHALETLFNNLEHFGFSYRNLVHTWFFIPQITGNSPKGEKYQVFNKLRKEKFLSRTDASGPHSFFPASTGIGSQNNAVLASAVAFKPGHPVSVRMIDNDRQVPAYDYPKQESIEPPLFSRGMCLEFETSAVFFVSGTASILDARTVHKNDIVAQTDQTIQNIHNLLAQNAMGHSVAPPAVVKQAINSATVYIKHDRDYLSVKKICENYFGDIPVLYVKADVCRDNLLVEIECIACMNKNLRRN